MKTSTTFKLLSCRVQILRISTRRFNHTELKRELAQKIPRERSRITDIRRRQAKEHLAEPKHGMLGLNDLVWETSEQNDEHELVFRGYSIPQILNELPKLPGTTIPPAEGHFWLLLTGKIPTLDNVKALMKDWDNRAIVPFFVEKLIRDLPPTTPPVEQLSSALNTLQSKFVESYTSSGVFKEKYWEMVLEDCMDLIAKVPTIAALIYNKLYRHKMFLPMRNPHADWASNFALQLGVNNKIFGDLMRLFMIVYSDLHGKNFSGTCLSGSALSDPYKSYATGLNQLASHKSGFYAHDHIDFLKKVHDEVGMHPTKQLILEYLQCKDYKNKEIPGYANLDFKGADPRYACMINFAKQHFGDDPLLILAELVSESISEMNSSIPNVDAISGLLFYLFGIREESFLPVMFGISRSLGLLSSYVWDRALGVPLEKKSESVTKSTIPVKGSCADFVKSHGISKNKLIQNTDIFPVITSAVTNLNVSLRPTSNSQNVKSAHQKNNIDLSSTLPTQESSSSISQISFPFSQAATGSIEKVIPDIQPQQKTTLLAPQSNSMVPVLQSQNNSNSSVSFAKSSGIVSNQKSKLTSVSKPTVPQSELNSNDMVTVSQVNTNLPLNSVSQSQTTPITESLTSKISDTGSVSKSQLSGMTSILQSQQQSQLSGMESVPQSEQSQLQSQARDNSNSTFHSQIQVNSIPTSQSKAQVNSNPILQSQTQMNSNSTKPMTQNSNVQPTALQSPTTNLQSPFQYQLHPSKECVSGQNSGDRKTCNDILKENTDTLKENNKTRHIMLSKRQNPSVNASGTYSNTNWGSTRSLKSTDKLNQSQQFNKIHKKHDKTKITSFLKEKQPSTNVRKSSGVDYWKCNY